MKVTNKALRPHEDSLTKVLKDTMPGLAPNAAGDTSQTIVTSAIDDRLLGVDQHRLLIRPDPFHVTVLFQPTLSFLQRVSESLPSGIESPQTSTVVLDQFVLNVYLPRLEEKVSDLFHDAVTGTYLSDSRSLKSILMHLQDQKCFNQIHSPGAFHRNLLPKCDIYHIKRYFFVSDKRIEGEYTSYGPHKLSMRHASQ
jgi:hypothetical protein